MISYPPIQAPSAPAPTPSLVLPAHNLQPEPLPTPVSIDNLESITDFFDQLETAILFPANVEDNLKFTHSGGTVKQAASIFVDFNQDFVVSDFGMPTPVHDLKQNWHKVVTEPSTIAELLLQGQQQHDLILAVGSGIMAPIMNAAMEEIFPNWRYFCPVGHGESYSLSLPVVWEPKHNGISQVVYVASVGFFTMLYITRLHLGPQILSRLLLQAVLND
ncbi:hypothetical protein FRC12_001875 [Ceratobasidium sp. 428]|nr:hypothetical protein FRC12_001875 [Ceratobasidium sp. 428]